jgi:hypothetical protein
MSEFVYLAVISAPIRQPPGEKIPIWVRPHHVVTAAMGSEPVPPAEEFKLDARARAASLGRALPTRSMTCRRSLLGRSAPEPAFGEKTRGTVAEGAAQVPEIRRFRSATAIAV